MGVPPAIASREGLPWQGRAVSKEREPIFEKGSPGRGKKQQCLEAVWHSGEEQITWAGTWTLTYQLCEPQ